MHSKASVRSSVAVLTLLLTCATAVIWSPGAHAETGARTVQYAETDIVQIRAKLRFSTLIVLPANEEILDATTGDKEFWIINGAHNLCYLHPAQAGIRSNLNLITSSGHVYSFLLTEVSSDSTAEPDLKVFVQRKEESTIGGTASVPPLARASEVQAYKTAVDAARAEASQAVQAAEDRAQKEFASTRSSTQASSSLITSMNQRARNHRSPSRLSITTTNSHTSSRRPKKNPPSTKSKTVSRI